MLKQVINKDVEVTANVDSISKVFTYEECNVLVIRDEDGNYWYKAKDIATILEYANTNDAIIQHVDDEYKKSFSEMTDWFTCSTKKSQTIKGSEIPTLPKIHAQTVFVDDSGFLQLISRSNKKAAVELWRKITKEILPTLFRTGYYEMPITDSDYNRINKSFYDDNMLSEFMGNPCVYFAYVGKHKVTINGITKLEDAFKFGNSTEISERDLEQHRKYYNTFNIIGIWKTLAHIAVEKRIKKNFESLEMVVKLKIKGKNRKTEDNKNEHVVLSQRHGLDYCLNMIQQVVNKTSLPQENEYKDEITKLKHRNELLTQRIKFLTKMNRQQKSNISQLKENLNDLRNKRKK